MTLAPSAAYVLTGHWFLVLTLGPLVALSAIVGVIAWVSGKSRVAAAFVLAPVLSLILVRFDLWLLERSVRARTDWYRHAGERAIAAALSTCNLRADSLLANSCEVRRLLPFADWVLSSGVRVVSYPERHVVVFSLRYASRLAVVYAPDAQSYPCERIGENVYVCGFARWFP